ncbi:hypothetical protein JQ594_28335 [Bradyrhizobium manausense]|uniref:hypothetical protein n=1 Tax=Bradyrhizobium manausense TaxID=989370 RepID=UPI001BA9DC95|nr:hypothetical protein [Bradyrhizobium manausense]MBR0689851.1 hypothetical protein [Bradyrhizobium manausense]
MKLILLLLFGLTIGLTMLLKYKVAPDYGPDVGARFLERLNYIPSQQPRLLSYSTFASWLDDPAKDAARNGYAFPVLFPYDLLFLICLGALLGFASVYFVSFLSFLSGVPDWVWWALPAAYIVADLAEDCYAAALLKSALALTDHSFALMRRLTTLKLATVNVAIGQVAFLGTLAALVRIFPAKA